jgi:perosamine synthetase
MPFYKEVFGTKEGDFPVAEKALKQVMCLPMHYCVTKEDVDYVKEALVVSLKEL